MKLHEYNEMMSYVLRRPMSNGGRIGFANGKSGAERMREYRERNPYKLKTTDIVADGVKYTIPNNAMKPESAKGFIKFLNKLEKNPTIENYGKLVKGLPKDVANQVRNYRYYLQGEKKGSFATGAGENLKKLFKELDLPKQSTNLLSKITSKDIKGQVVKTATKAAGEAAKGTSMDVANAVRDIFVNDPNNAPSLDDIAEGLEGSSKWNAASKSEKIKMRTAAKNSVNTFLQAVTADRKVKGFKDIAPETLGDIIQYIDDNKRGEFGFSEGLIRDYKIKLRDSLIKGDFAKQRRNIPGQKGKVIDEVFGLSATFENAPGYTENVQIISEEANKLKRTQIDKPFAAILKAVKEGRDNVTFDKKRNVPISEAIKKFNVKSKTFSNVNKISTPQIFVGDNLDATKLVSNFDKYSPQAQKNILKNAKEGFVLNATKPSTPVSTLSKAVRGSGPTLGANLMPADQVKRLVDFRKIPEDIKNVSEEVGKPLKEKGKIFGKKAAQQIAQFGGSAVLPMLGAPLTAFEASRIAREEGKPTTESIADVFLLGGVVRERRIANAMGPEAYKEFAKQKYERDIVGRIGSPRGEGIVSPELLELRKIAEQQVNLEDQARRDAFLERQSEQGLFPEIDRTGAMYGGRVGFAEGPKDPGRRKFVKLMGILAALPYGIGKLIRTTESVAPVIKQGAKIGYDKFLELAAKIKILGKKDPGRTTMDRQEVTVYRGKDGSEYELTEDITTGDVRITKDKPGMAQFGDEVYDTIQDRTTMEYKKGSTDVDPKTGKKIQYPDEYDEVKEVAGPDGTFDDIDEVDDIIAREIDEEIK